MVTYIILTISIVFNALANIFIKAGMNRLNLKTYAQSKNLIIAYVANPFIWLGLASFALAFVCYSYVLSKINVSIAYPINVSAGIIIVIIVSVLFLKESITITQVIGFTLIMTGVWLVAK